MRLRILTIPPLPDLRAWFSTESLDPSATVFGLKRGICSRVQPLKDARIHETDIALVLDDFDLLNDSSLDVVRDGDLLCIRLLPRKNSTKRKTLHDDSRSTRKQPSSLGSSSSDSESCSSTESTSSSLSSLPHSQPSKILPVSRSGASKTVIAPLVPPWQGKHTTHSRNIRRRIKKQYERNGGLPPTNSSAANTQPLSSKRTVEHTVGGDTVMASNLPTTVMMSLRNKNKKKGFKNCMANPPPKKIIFESTEQDHEPTCSSLLPSTAQVYTGSSLPRLIPPSEKQDNLALPSNIFVTIADVEEGPWSKKKRQQRQTYASEEEVDNEQSWLDYGEEMIEPDEALAVKNVTRLDFERAETNWKSFVEVTELSQLVCGMVVGWKALAIKPSTFTPEMLLSLAIVSSCNSQEVVVRPLHGAGQISFGMILEQGENLDEESYEWADVISSEWRIVN